MSTMEKKAQELLAWSSSGARKLYGDASAAVVGTSPDDDEAKLLRLRVQYNHMFAGVDRDGDNNRGDDEVEKVQPESNVERGVNGVGGNIVFRDVEIGSIKKDKTPRKRPRVSHDDVARVNNDAPFEKRRIDERTVAVLQKGTENGQGKKRRMDSAMDVEEATSKQVIDAVRKGWKADRALTTALKLARDRPKWHAPWKNYRVIMGHHGWVRCVAVDPTNEWFATGAADRTIKIWDLASGQLKLTLTGHIGAVRAICLSDRHPYMFTTGDDKTVKCWDLEQNKVIRQYHGHLSGVYSAAIHPSLDILMTGGRDATVRVWDMRTKAQIFALGGHNDVVNTIVSQSHDPQIISGSGDSTVRMWDLAAGRSMATLTNHKKGVRAIALHPRQFTFASASADNIKTWRLPRGEFMRNLSGHNSIVNALAVNEDGVCVSGGDDGSLMFWDYKAAHPFQRERMKIQPGSLDSEAGVFATAFDHSGSRLVTCNADKTIQMWKEDEDATEETHPVDWKPDLTPKYY
eukprot:Plantae.Rhodophyta-Hildenbrandia_rubra.ctg24364.p1 GENE.Plantae.Rhodophyta-Hildenbrandia_rubra.ctg24364~~Plantae.Rhodophyta-Hildenbrandia_rubra.ctg24364.p1  ORF type:complete len:517 (+),score=116.71 Plantae.Rhodophyta-Hildenbrandia_rubra.ctg24364:1703-3253(+)